jgi:hypothetical protein
MSLRVYRFRKKRIDTKKIFMNWLDTCPVVEHRTINNIDEDSEVYIYNVDFAVEKENEDD